MTCQELIDFIADYLSNELPEDQRRVFEQHIQVCGPCRKYLGAYRKTVEVARRSAQGPCSDIPDELMRAILASARK